MDILIISGARTPFCEWVGGKRGDGKPGGALADVTAIDLGAIALKEAIKRANIEPSDIDHVIFGNCLQTSSDAIYGARHVALKAGVPVEVPALTISRICGTGIQAAVTGAQHILLGEAEIVGVGGTENMSQAPLVIRGARRGVKLKHLQLEDYLLASLLDPMCGLYMAQTAENLAKKKGISREEQDEYALRSHTLTTKSVREGKFKEEIVPVKTKKGEVTDDDHFVPNCTMEGLSRLKPAFGEGGTVTAGNASGIVDGACALILASEKKVKEKNLPVLGRIVSWGVAGVEPDIMGIGPVPAIRNALKRANMNLSQIDLFEINEAFAAQYLAVEKELELDREKVNVNGGAIGIGHPLAATGSRLIYTLLLELKRRNKKYGIASACIGGGQGIAIIVEAV